MVTLVSLSAFSKAQSTPSSIGQPSEERKAQDSLPKSKDAMWQVLSKTKIHVDEKKGLYSATYPDESQSVGG